MMKIIYTCYGGAHSSIVASAIHMGYLPVDRIPTKEEILNIPYYDQSPKEFRGTPIYIGTDEKLREIYALGMGPYRREYTEIAYNFAFQLSNDVKKNIQIINVIPLLSFSVKIGGFLSRRVGLIKLGRPLTVAGIQKRYNLFIELVEDVKKRC
ncbi:DUF3189 family protein [Alkaliphilus sp. B6464]|uniref:DUF3189 family protein n=1 Tax=Alkaliphilus sp. B6464 TaxID=2731219 RepID=UPI001BA4A684|nr:DUF3189 family protein [Alkaliphilus sp. B6464]QUH20931.1 DUF3189 family protein [Alkaliphilus sp. B6464]